jgi:hypothetical protein
MSRIAPILLAATVGCALGDESRTDVACVYWPGDAQPLLVGDSMRLTTGTLYNDSDCNPPPPPSVSWGSEQPAVVSVDSTGLVHARTPGRFTVVGITGDDTVRAEGFVLPPGWTARLTPDSATVRVGDSVSFMMIALDSVGGQLPIVPYWLYTPEWRSRWPRDTTGKPVPPRLTTEHAFQHVTTPSVFHVEKPGRTLLIGQIGDRRDTATLVVLPADSARP